MDFNNLKTRNEMNSKYKWNIEAMISDESTLYQDLESLKVFAESFATKFAGHITDNEDTLLASLKERDILWERLEKIFVYARMRRDEDNANSNYQALTDKCTAIMAQVSAATSFYTPELLSSSEEKILTYIEHNAELKTYEFALKDVLRLKAHVLSKDEENILAQMSEVTRATNDVFTMLNNADITFEDIQDEDGNTVELTHGNYINLMESHNREVRSNAFKSMYTSYKSLINTLASAYNYNTKTDVISARIRKHESARAAALSGDNIPASVYDKLVEVVNKNLPTLHRYINLRKKILGVDKLYMHDMYVPLIELPKKDVPYEEALDIMRDALSPLGEEYISKMNQGIKEGWIDVYENKGKTSGAYSFGCYDSFPYILLNYTNTLKDVFTLVHEMGHSMHSRYTRDEQPYIYGSHSIFTAEVASTVNESLLMHHLISNENELTMKKYLLNIHLEEFRTTLFRQTMFAEFEDLTHFAIENGEVITAEWMCDKYETLNDKYYGPSIEKDDYIKYEWARIPHFYNSFYVYKYATGYSAACAISNKIINEGSMASKNYIDFLKTGESNHPIELLKIAGVDMGTPVPVENAMSQFKLLLDEFESLL